MPKKRIIFYVPRTSVLNSFIDHIYLYLNNSITIYIFHADSLYKDFSSEKPYEKIDIGKWKLNRIINKVKTINPTAFICLHFASLNEKLLLRLMKKVKIPVFYLQHGLLLEDQLGYGVNNFVYLKNNLFPSISRNILFIRNYIRFIFSYSRNILEVEIFYKMCFKNNFFETPFDKAIFFTSESFKMVNSRFNYKIENVLISGFPLFKSDMEMNQFSLLNKKSSTKYIVYVHSPFVFSGSTNMNYEDERNYLIDFFSYFIDHNYKIKYLLHPRESLKSYIELYKAFPEIQVLKEPNSVELLSRAHCVIGHSSTVLLNALYLKTPIIQLPYPGNFESVPIIEEHSIYINNIFELKKYFGNGDKIEDLLVEFKTNFSPTSTTTSFENLANIIKSLC